MPTPPALRRAVATAIVASAAAILLVGCDQQGSSASRPSYQSPSDGSYRQWRDGVFEQQRDNSLRRQRSY